MSARRNQYTSTPLMRMDKHARSVIREEPPVVLDQEAERIRHHRVLGLIMLAILPVAAVVVFIINKNPVSLVFIGVMLFFVLLMWLMRAFANTARARITLVHIAICCVVALRIILSTPGSITQKVANRMDESVFTSDSALDTPTLSDIESAAAEETPVPEATPAPMSAAQARLDEFMAYWAMGDQRSMLNMCSPSWVDKQSNAMAQLWNKAGMFNPTSYMVERVDGSDTDSSRSIMIIANISKSSGEVESRRYQIMMQRFNDVWYIDPVSLNSIGIVTPDDPQPFEQISSIITYATATPTPVPTVDPGMLLYYNTNGGKRYHADQYCSSVQSSDLPLKGILTYAQLDDPDYRTLKRCGTCHAPEREK